MALLDTHPDYMVFPGAQPGWRGGTTRDALPRVFLSMLPKIFGQFGHPLPKEMAGLRVRYVKEELTSHRLTRESRIEEDMDDLDNTRTSRSFYPSPPSSGSGTEVW